VTRAADISPNTLYGTGVPTGTPDKIAIAWAENDIQAVQAGTLATQITNSGTLPAVTTMYLGVSYDGAAQPLNGYIYEMFYVPRRMTDAQLIAVTS
jgi:hypothetical protein